MIDAGYIYISSPSTLFCPSGLSGYCARWAFRVGRIKCVVDTRNGWPVYAAASRSLCLCGVVVGMILYVFVIYIFLLYNKTMSSSSGLTEKIQACPLNARGSY